ncbi:M14 family metallopeptidase [Gilvibacter sediminis]|uniref:M14 family metallopeptidase n=1 Tax=Gilvibacter sediminis TaxID=379071 RepID=UPI00234FECF1|nr:M14 family metallopeptidase [Gilvibacter sediminis]MDC7998523.1 M14 family metallopeptidase [Gilvibacter sediminis]
MTRYLALVFILLLLSCNSEVKSDRDFTTLFETSNGTQTPEYKDVISYYDDLSETYTSVAMYEMDRTDSGERLHLVTFNPNRSFDSELGLDGKQVVVLINNGIHPGESDGIDASMMLIRDLAQGKIKAPKNVIIAVIPVYNIGGSLNRNSHSRTNQNGPEAYGFRGNARNYDLNRDFIKSDTWNALAFQKLFDLLDPDVFIDNHVSNGADYQYTLTHLFTQHNKLGGKAGKYLHEVMMPALEDSLASKNWDITPYVNVFNRTPEGGFSQFMDGPRYSTGYTSLYNTLGLMVETHMLKPYKDRVEGTYALMESVIGFSEANAEQIKNVKREAWKNYKTGSYYPISWAIDSSQTTTLNFKGYEGTYVPSEITGANRLKYNHDQPFEKPVTYYNYFKPTDSVQIPDNYIVPKGWWRVLTRLRANGVIMDQFDKDTTMTVTAYRIADYKTYNRPYEGHYPHYNTKVEPYQTEVMIPKGSYRIPAEQEAVRYLLETLEPAAVDSFFNWNFFDTVLQQKEGFSPYVWEDLALDYLNENPEIKTEFETKKANDANFAGNWYAQLDWIHKNSPYYEAAHLRYPIYRVSR